MTKMLKEKLRLQQTLCIVADEWSAFGSKYLGIVAAIPGEHILIDFSCPDAPNRIAEVLTARFRARFEELGILGKVFAGVSDCAGAMINAVHPRVLYWLPCACHVVNRALIDLYISMKFFNLLEAKVAWFRNCLQFHFFLKHANSPLKSVSSFTPTRWLSLSGTLSDIKRLRKHIEDFQEHIELMRESKRPDGYCPFSQDDLDTICALQPIISQIATVMARLEENREYQIFDALFLIMTIQETTTERLREIGFSPQADILRKGIAERLQKYEIYDYLNILIAATILNPIRDVKQVLPESMHGRIGSAESWIRQHIPASFEYRPMSSQQCNEHKRLLETLADMDNDLLSRGLIRGSVSMEHDELHVFLARKNLRSYLLNYFSLFGSVF